ncbi:hypothetical protein [Streptomyces roseochromogenus]|uniref:hypothetical protein n=1 Tax=Streptomyces roseochromogenus TaxID=285450 RepID=UPI00269F2704
MDPAALRAWAGVAPRLLDALPHHVGAELLATTRLALELTAVNAAKAPGVSCNMVRARMDRVAALLGADFSRLAVRAVAHVALNAEAAHGSYDPRGAHSIRRPAVSWPSCCGRARATPGPRGSSAASATTAGTCAAPCAPGPAPTRTPNTPPRRSAYTPGPSGNTSGRPNPSWNAG